MQSISFVVEGKPLTWSRAQRGRYGQSFTPPDRESKMSQVRDAWRSLEVEPFPKSVDLALGVRVFCIRPENHFRANGALKPWALTARPRGGTNGGDLDNFVKLICDALNAVAFYDDAQVVEYLDTGKWYAGFGEMPHTEVTLAPVSHLVERPREPQLALAA